MNFLQDIFASLAAVPERVVLEEMRPERRVSTTAKALLERIAAARAFLTAAGLHKGDRCALLAPNSIDWVALDVAAMAEGILVVPLYARQAPAELAAMIRDAQPAIVCCGDGALQAALVAAYPAAPRTVLLEEIFAAAGTSVASAVPEPVALADSDPLTIIYTSGTSGESKGVVLNAGNVTYMLSCTMARLDLLMGKRAEPDHVFHYLPFCFAGSWILLLTSLLRASELRLCTDLSRLADDLREAAPEYCLNVPQLLERMRSAVEAQIAKRGGILNTIFAKAKAASLAPGNGRRRRHFPAAGAEADFPGDSQKAGAQSQGADLRIGAAGAGDAAFLQMLGIPVLQVYGLTETTAICTMDDPATRGTGHRGSGDSRNRNEAGRGRRNSGARAEHFSRATGIGRKRRPKRWRVAGSTRATRASKLPAGNWRIIGRLKNLLILSSGHNIAPEPLEEKLAQLDPGRAAGGGFRARAQLSMRRWSQAK